MADITLDEKSTVASDSSNGSQGKPQQDASTTETSTEASSVEDTSSSPLSVDAFDIRDEEEEKASEEDMDTQQQATNDSKRSVKFHTVIIREYSRCLGNNPAVTHGPPLSIDWSYEEACVYDLDEYEQSRPPRRMTYQMLVPGMVREEIILSQTDCTRNQMNSVVKEVKVVRQQRQACVAMQEFENVSYAVETIRRRFRRLKTGISKKREEEMLWENAQKSHVERTSQVAQVY